jgi:hypothetical protein
MRDLIAFLEGFLLPKMRFTMLMRMFYPLLRRLWHCSRRDPLVD